MRTLIVFTILIAMLFPANSQTRDEMTGIYNEGLYFLNRGDYKEAAFYFRKLRKNIPTMQIIISSWVNVI